MLTNLTQEPQNIIVVGDAFVSPATMEDAMRASQVCIGQISQFFWGSADKDAFAARQLNVERVGPEAEPWADGLETAIADCTVLFTHFNPIPRALIEKAPKLQVILTCRGGLEHIDLDAASQRGIPVINVIRNAIPVAEFTIGMMLDLTRNIAISHHRLIQGDWFKQFPNANFTTTLSNLTVGLIGLGNIGIEVAIRLKALGVPMMIYDAYLDPKRLPLYGLENVPVVDTLEELFRSCDIVSLHLRLTPETLHSIDKRYFSLMKPTAYFISAARGGLINQQDLIDALRSHSIAGAALDVFESEPLSPDAGFVGLDNVLLTPHIAGATVDAIPNSPYLLVRELDKILTSGILDRVVNRKALSLN